MVGTVAGLAVVLGSHTIVAPQSIGPLLPGTLPSGSGPGFPSTTGKASVTTGTTATATTAAATTAAPTTARTATGTAINYNYGVLSVSATITGTRLTGVGIASIDDGGSSRSQSIDQQAIPVLEQEALQAQGAKIQGVSGASYTSAGFQQSLQSALTQLAFQ